MLRADHIVFPVWNAQASLDFYRGTMGFALVDTHEGADWGGHPWLMMVFAVGDGREVVLVSLKGAQPPPRSALPSDAHHLAFAESTPERLDEWRRKLAAAGIAFHEESHGPQSSLYFEDPNGVTLEIAAPPSAPASEENAEALAAARRWIAQS